MILRTGTTDKKREAEIGSYTAPKNTVVIRYSIGVVCKYCIITVVHDLSRSFCFRRFRSTECHDTVYHDMLIRMY